MTCTNSDRISALMSAIIDRERPVGTGRAATSAMITIAAQMASRHSLRERKLLVLHMREELAALEQTLDRND